MTAGLRVLIERLLPLATVITPNVDEAASLTGLPVTNLEQMRVAAAKLHEMGAPAWSSPAVTWIRQLIS